MALTLSRANLGHVNVPDAVGLRLTTWRLDVIFRVRVQPTAGQVFSLAAKGELTTASGGNYGIRYRNDAGTYRLGGHFVDDGLVGVRSCEGALTLTPGRYYLASYTFSNATKAAELHYAAADYRGEDGATTSTTLATATHAALVPNNASTRPLRFGLEDGAAGDANGADIDVAEVRPYSTADSKATIDAALWTRVERDAANLIGLWRCDEHDGPTVYDRSGAGRNGTLVNLDAAWSWTDPPTNLRYFPSGPTALIGWCSATRLPGTTIAGSSDAATWPASRLRDGRAASKTRSTTDGATTWTLTFPHPVPILAVSIGGHNWTSAVTLTVTIAGVAETVTYAPGLIVHVLARVREGTTVVLTATDAANPSNYHELGTLDAWVCFDPREVCDIDQAREWVDRAQAVVTSQASRTVRTRTRARRVSMRWGQVRAELSREMERCLALAQRNGRMLLCGDVQRELYGPRAAIVGTVESAAVEALVGPAGRFRTAGRVVVLEDVAS